jgi:hypothetical protein
MTRIAIVVYPRYTALDFIGPYQGRCPNPPDVD